VLGPLAGRPAGFGAGSSIIPAVLRALLLDFNGVLVDDEPLHLELLLRVLGEEGVSLAPDEAWPRFLGRGDRDSFAEALAGAGQPAPGHRLTRLVARKASYYQEAVHRQGYVFFPGALELMREAAAAGLVQGIVSGALRDEIEGALRQAGVRGLVKVVVSIEDVEEGKPSPQGYQLALQLLNSEAPLPSRLLHPHEVLAVEDTLPGLAAARAAGLVTLGIAHSHEPSALSGAHAVAERLEGLGLERLQALYAEASGS
jgi:HAD superfamily hydrolase (TIGR01509 family)